MTPIAELFARAAFVGMTFEEGKGEDGSPTLEVHALAATNDAAELAKEIGARKAEALDHLRVNMPKRFTMEDAFADGEELPWDWFQSLFPREARKIKWSELYLEKEARRGETP